MRTHHILPSVFTLLVLAGCRKDAAQISVTTAPAPISGDTVRGGGPPTADPLPGPTPTADENAASFTTYTIPKGEHYCLGNAYAVDTFYGAHFQAIFDSSCIYTTADPANQADINKLYGFSDAASHHHQNSARFGWNWERGALRIHSYAYLSGIRQSREICTVSLGVPHTFRIELRAGQYFFAVDDQHYALMERGAHEPYAHGYELLPYFGGDEVAPHDMRIKIKKLP